MNRRILLATGAAALVSLLASNATASPWTLQKDQFLLSVNYDFAFAEKEYLPDGTFQNFPLNGKFNSSNLRLGARYGFSSKFELAAELTVKSVNYRADPVILGLPEGADTVDLDTARGIVTNFNRSEIGPSDVFVTGRYNLVRGLFAMANETRVKLPTGYTPPQGTFDQETGAVADDVALGDGQTDLENSLLVGVFIPQTRTFGRADVGFRFRFGDPGHQVIGGARAGQFLGQHFVLFAGASGASTVIEGNVIGQTFISTSADLQPDEATPGENVTPVDLRLDKDWLAVEGGLLLIASPNVELQVGYSHIVVGANIPAIQTVSLGTAVRWDDFTTE